MLAVAVAAFRVVYRGMNSIVHVRSSTNAVLCLLRNLLQSAHERLQDLWDSYSPARLIPMILQDGCQHSRHGQSGAVQGKRKLELVGVGSAHSSVQATTLVVCAHGR